MSGRGCGARRPRPIPSLSIQFSKSDETSKIDPDFCSRVLMRGWVGSNPPPGGYPPKGGPKAGPRCTRVCQLPAPRGLPGSCCTCLAEPGEGGSAQAPVQSVSCHSSRNLRPLETHGGIRGAESRWLPDQPSIPPEALRSVDPVLTNISLGRLPQGPHRRTLDT
jgi:hypothetical protein